MLQPRYEKEIVTAENRTTNPSYLLAAIAHHWDDCVSDHIFVINILLTKIFYLTKKEITRQLQGFLVSFQAYILLSTAMVIISLIQPSSPQNPQNPQNYPPPLSSFLDSTFEPQNYPNPRSMDPFKMGYGLKEFFDLAADPLPSFPPLFNAAGRMLCDLCYRQLDEVVYFAVNGLASHIHRTHGDFEFGCGVSSLCLNRFPNEAMKAWHGVQVDHSVPAGEIPATFP